MTGKINLILIFYFCFIISYAQEVFVNEHELFSALKTNNILLVDSLLPLNTKSNLKYYAEVYRSKLIDSKLDTSLFFTYQKRIKNNRWANLYKLLEGDYQLLNIEQDSLALSTYQKVLKMGKKLNDTVLVCEAYKRLNSYLFKNSEQRSLFDEYSSDYLNYVYDVNEEAYALYYRLGYRMLSVERDDKEFSLGTKDFIKLINIAKKSENRILEASANQLFGVKYWAFDENYEKALEYYTKAMEIYIGLDFKEAKVKSFGILVNISAIYIGQNRPEKAIKNLWKANKINLPNSNKKDYIQLYDKLLKAHVQLGNIDSTFYYLKKKETSVFKANTLRNAKNIKEIETKYQTAQKEKQILEEQQKVRANRNWLIAACLALVFGAGIAVLFQKNTTKKRLLAEQETQLKQERVDNLLKEQELVSIDAMIAGQEKERQRVANELHDDLGSLMATIKLHFDNSKVSKKDPGLQNAQKLLDQAYQKVRGMAHSKNSGVMSDQGLLPAIKKMAQVITDTNALEVVVEDFGMGDRLENSLELNLFRMVQELVANTIKHAEASQVSIQLTQHEDNLNIIIEDNGKGFDRSKIETNKTGMGLTTIEKRVEHLEGNFTVDSVLGKGTSILIDIPL